MTADVGFCSTTNNPDVNYRNLEVACKLAEKAGATTCLITGKGEPTLYPDLITKYIEVAKDYFPFIELQTNGMKLNRLGSTTYIDKHDIAPRQTSYLDLWYELGLTTICLSAVSTENWQNRQIYGEKYPLISPLAKKLTDRGFTVRLSIMMLKDYIYLPKHIENLINFCKLNDCKQLTIRPIARPDNIESGVAKWIDEHAPDDNELLTIKHFIQDNATPVMKLAHGATVYDYKGQNICLANCLTTNETDENIRQIIFYPDGTIGYDWKYKGAVLL
jgi:hypothetical protein